MMIDFKTIELSSSKKKTGFGDIFAIEFSHLSRTGKVVSFEEMTGDVLPQNYSDFQAQKRKAQPQGKKSLHKRTTQP